MRRSEFAVGGTDPTNEYLYDPDELVVHVDDREIAADELGDRYEVRSRPAVGRQPTDAPVVFVRRQGAPSVDAALDQLRGRAGGAVRTSPQYVFGACGPRVPMAADRPQATTSQLPPLEETGGGVTVGVIDTGIVLRDAEHDGAAHPWLASRLGDGCPDEDELTEVDGMLDEAAGHGTFVAGVVLGEAPSATIRAVATLAGGYVQDDRVADAITELAERGVLLINLSFCGDIATDSTAPPSIERALSALPDDVVVVAAAGNFGDTRPVWPAASKRVIAVGAVNVNDADGSLIPPALAPFSGYGSWVDAYAGGVSVLGPYCWYRESGDERTLGRAPQDFRGWARWSGTSAATAIVTGRIARVAADEGIEPFDAARRVLRDAPRITVSGERESFTRPYIASPVLPRNASG